MAVQPSEESIKPLGAPGKPSPPNQMRPGPSAGTGSPAGGAITTRWQTSVKAGRAVGALKITLVPLTRWVGNVGNVSAEPLPPPEREQTPLFHGGINELPGEPASVTRMELYHVTHKPPLLFSPRWKRRRRVQTSPAALMFKPKPKGKDVT